MQALFRKISLLFVAVLLIGPLASFHARASNLSEARLFLLPEQSFEVDQVADALNHIFEKTPNTDNLIFYVHGRSCGSGGEPHKSLKKVMPKLENDYNARVLMFYWPGSGDGCPNGFPMDKAAKAGPMLTKALQALQRYKQNKPEKFNKVKMTLLLHSMGNIVFENFLHTYQEKNLASTLFDTTVLNSSATASKNHDEWLKKLDFSRTTYVTVNDDDKILILAGTHEHGTRLGKGLNTGIGNRPVKLASNAIYVDVTDIGVNHQYFIRSGQKVNPYLRKFYETIMNGQAFDFAGFDGVKKVDKRDGASIYYLKEK